MPEPVMEATYCSQDIVIPSSFPHILKVFAKAAIRTQPYDLLRWAAAYFKALADGSVPPVKERLEYPLIRSEGGMSYGYLKLLVKQFESPEEIEQQILAKRWSGVCLQEKEFKQILCTGGLYKSSAFPLHKFIAIAAGFLCNNVTQTMIMLCEIYTDEPDGANASIPATLFIELYRYLANIDASQEFTYYDGLFKEDYDAKIQKSSEIIEEEKVDLTMIDRWVPRMMGWRTDSAVLKKNVVLGEDMPVEGGKISTNIAMLLRVPRERFTDPAHPDFPEIPSEDLKCHVEESEKSLSIVPCSKTKQSHKSTSEGSNEKDDEDFEKEVEENEEKEQSVAEEESLAVEIEEPVVEAEEPIVKVEESVIEAEEPTVAPEALIVDTEGPAEEAEESTDKEEGDEPIGKEEATKTAEGSNVLLQVFSEEGKKIRSLSLGSNEEGKEDVSVKEREAIIEQLEMNKEKRVSEFMETIESLDNLVEETRKLKHEVDKMGCKDLPPCDDNLKSPPSGEESSGGSSSGTRLSKIAEEHIPDIIVVPPKPGIGPIVDLIVIEDVVSYIEETASFQAGVIMPRDILHVLCPPLEKKVPIEAA